MQPQPMICVSDVPRSSRWYQVLLGAQSGHGGPAYEQLMLDDRMLLQLHLWEAHEHPHLGDPQAPSRGNGVALWFQTDAFDAALARIRALGAEVLEDAHLNPNANHREIWLRDPDGYLVVIAGAYGDV
jgi:catechol 2,3-dioxygenase-like lactoylglutathione lyase family enzyme